VTSAVISLALKRKPICCSCHACFSKGDEYCPHNAVVGTVAKSIEECDGLIISGVCYAMQLNAAMKNIVDHLAYYFHRPRLFNKVGMVVTTTAGAGENIVAKYLRQTMGHWGVGKAILLPMKIQTEQFALTEKQTERVRIAAERFYYDIKNGRLSPPSFMSVIVHNSFRASASVTPPLSECDCNYWRGSGFADKVYPRKIGVLKWLTGRMMYPLVRKMFSKLEI